MRKLLSLISIIVALISCSGGRQDNRQEGTAYTTLEPLSYTNFTDSAELFVEFRPFVVNQETSFAAHLNDLVNFKPFREGSLQVDLYNQKNRYSDKVDSPSDPGIFRPVITPLEPGVYSLLFLFEHEGIKDSIIIDSLIVYREVAAIPATLGGRADEIIYLKEQAWKTTFATREAGEKPFHTVITTGARVKAQPSGSAVLSASAAGQVSLLKVTGERVNKGELVGTISGGSLENNLSIRLNEFKTALDKSKADYERTRPLTTSQAISEKDFLGIITRYRQDSMRYYQLADKVTGNLIKLISPINGVVSEIMVNNGSYVETGSNVARIIGETDLLIEAYVNQSDHRLIEGIFDANFRDPSGNRLYRLSDLKGKVRSANAFLNDELTRIPVSFNIQNDGSLIPGMFLEAFLFTKVMDNAIVVPYSAILEEQGKYYVYLETGGESFVKREVIISGFDGLNAGISAGLVPGERVVTKGIQQIRLSSMAGGLPIHGHTH